MGTARMARPTYEQLEARVRQLEAQNARLEARVVQLERFLDKATRDGKRQAAPFSKGPPKDKPKRPGRKSGTKYGSKAHRPLPDQKPDEIIDVPTPERCDECGGAVDEDHVDQQVQMEIPRRPILRRFDIHVGTCRGCGKRFRPRHALQTSDALGAAASQLGPDLQAMIAMMKDKYSPLPSRHRSDQLAGRAGDTSGRAQPQGLWRKPNKVRRRRRGESWKFLRHLREKRHRIPRHTFPHPMPPHAHRITRPDAKQIPKTTIDHFTRKRM